ncbi:GTPase IMAP family member 2-like [Embiotoca jacksoni]|uniref:GTPase IMAP family member 2-like n=1 Tax=Embiotoca jacksoni TaxID=100190 RepID=UPI003703FD69
MATATPVPDVKPLKRSHSFELLPPDMSELRVVLLGDSLSLRTEVMNFILQKPVFHEASPPWLRDSCPLKDQQITVINTSDLLFPTADKMKGFLQECVRLSAPGPHVFLLLLQPEDFTEEHKQKLCRVLENYSDRWFHHSLVLISPPRDGRMEYMNHQPLKDLIQRCRYRYVWKKNLKRSELLTR